MTALAPRLGTGRRPRLVAVVTGRPAGRSLGDLVSALAGGGVDLVQVRDHEQTDRALVEAVASAVAAARPWGTLVLVNDRLDVALAAGAAGVHLKANGLAPEDVRAAAGRAGASGLILSLATHDALGFAAALASGAVDLVTLGPLNATPGKTPHGVAGLATWLDAGRGRCGAALTVPWIVLGGVTPADVPDLAALAAPGEPWGVAAVRPFAVPPDGERDLAAEAAREFVRALGVC